jgi:hypothetical protein
LFTFLFVKGSKRDITVATDFTTPVATINPADDTVLKFSPTSPTRTDDHHLLHKWQSRYYQDLQQYVLHEVLLAPGSLGAHWNTYICVCVPTGMPRPGARRASRVVFSVGNLFYAK